MLKIRNYSYIWSEYRTLYVLGITLITKIGKNTMALLDQIDIKILQALQNNAKVNMKELSAELNISKTPVYERVKRLEEEGYIRNYVALVDNKKVGLPLVVFCNV